MTRYRHTDWGVGGLWSAHAVPENTSDAPYSRLEGIQNESALSLEDKGLNPPPSPLD